MIVQPNCHNRTASIPSTASTLSSAQSGTLIRDIVQESLSLGYLSREAEERLRVKLRRKYDSEDFRAFMQLQIAIREGQIRQESREQLLSTSDDSA